jgi:hypothetical protein
LFFSRKRGADGGLKAISRVQAWTILKAASEPADVRVLALRASHHGAATPQARYRESLAPKDFGNTRRNYADAPAHVTVRSSDYLCTSGG